MKNSFKKTNGGNTTALAICLAVFAFVCLGCFGGGTSEPKDSDKTEKKVESSAKDDKKSPDKDENKSGEKQPDEDGEEASTADASKGEEPSTSEMQAMVKEVLDDFNSAVQAEDFTDFRAKTSKPFQKQTPVEKFNESFKTFIDQKSAFGKVVDSIDEDAEFTSGPNISKKVGINHLEVKGKYATYPALGFEMTFIPEGKEWKLIEIRIKAGQD